ncbi:MAG: M23 family metallopeptidase [Gemmatimonadaceae bacterium]
MKSRSIALGVVALALPSLGVRRSSVSRDCVEPAQVRWSPSNPKPGTFFLVTVRRAEGSALAGDVAGEPLHFTSGGDSAWAIAPIPIDSTRGVALRLSCAGGDTTRLRVRSSTATYAVERLRVDPRFASQPDSALAARLKRESDMARAVADASHDTPRLWTGPFLPPRTSRVTSRYGTGREFNGAITSRHLGTDFAGETGALVHAVNRGVVRMVEAFYMGGNVIYVDHGAGITTAYLHLSRALVSVGDTVSRGQELGRVGATGRVTGPHLHLIARYGRDALDPLSLLALTRAPAPPVRRPRRPSR